MEDNQLYLGHLKQLAHFKKMYDYYLEMTRKNAPEPEESFNCKWAIMYSLYLADLADQARKHAENTYLVSVAHNEKIARKMLNHFLNDEELKIE